MSASIARAGAYAGWLSVIGIFAYHIGLSIFVGQRVSGTTDAAAIVAYYKHPAIAEASLEQFLVIVAMTVFALALREILGVNPRTRFFATLGLLFVVVEIPVILVEISVQATLVTAATNGSDVVPLFRFWDVLYNSGTYVLEAAWVTSFGLAMREVAGFPRWMPRFSLLVAGLQLVNLTAIWVGIPDWATLPGNMLLAVWFVGASVGLGRLAASPTRVGIPQPA
jgi:hypothetical protein